MGCGWGKDSGEHTWAAKAVAPTLWLGEPKVTVVTGHAMHASWAPHLLRRALHPPTTIAVRVLPRVRAGSAGEHPLPGAAGSKVRAAFSVGPQHLP